MEPVITMSAVRGEKKSPGCTENTENLFLWRRVKIHSSKNLMRLRPERRKSTMIFKKMAFSEEIFIRFTT